MTPTLESLAAQLAQIDANLARIAAIVNPPTDPTGITETKLEALADLMDASCQTIRRCRLRAANGDIRPDEAAVIIDDVRETINRFCES